MSKKIIAIMLIAVVLAVPIIMADKETNSKKTTNEISDNNGQHKGQMKHQQNIIDDMPNAIRGHRQNEKNDIEDAKESEEEHPIDINSLNMQPRHDFAPLSKHDDENEYDDEKRFVNLTEMAQKQIDVATALINDANNALNNTNLTQKQITKAQHAIDKAEKHLAKAREAFSNGKYGKAFGQATAARAQALHASRILKIMTIPPVVHWVRISGTIFNDINGNGIMNSGDNGLANWTVFIDTNGNGILDNETSTITDAYGRYVFANLTPGNYTVREIVRSGWTNTTSPAATVHILKRYDAVANFGNFKLGEISGMKFIDINGNGIMDNETGLSNWTITLTGPINLSTTTNANGTYSFNGLTAGTYTLVENHQTGWIQAKPNSNYTINVQSGTVSQNNNFGNFKLGEISGTVFNDTNNNTFMDNETGLTNWTVVLTGAINATTQTNATGAYQFTGLLPGTYSVSEVLQANWTQTSPAAVKYTINITSGSVTTGNNFGNFLSLT